MRHLALLLALLGCALGQPPSSLNGVNIDMASTLECHRRLYTYKVQQADAAGHLCWDDVHVWSCWGRCDSNEISDWRFPFKRSFHPVCMHEDRLPRTVLLKNCATGASPGTELYTVLEAASCRCAVCKSSEASCEGLRYRGQRSGQLLG
ncbi:hypothetical protein B566_EDAN014027 [Ephemera danica]|nr:hypothetical protein B566_EDAN014027 [Ephemera danica]